ncbi:hypothetical protein [Pseudarthrobacter siccitolerans]|uniref:hypothetical protein n=1 Tax=Pseudarthrobacter siccitolerans TaxID=861266 RepID=UPI00128D573D|nr:hypothetical protein [Pseudarthrobacter siccitolerans]
MTWWQASLVHMKCRIWLDLSGKAGGHGLDFSPRLIRASGESGNGHAFDKTSAMQHYYVPTDGQILPLTP